MNLQDQNEGNDQQSTPSQDSLMTHASCLPAYKAYVDQLPTSASWVLALQANTVMASFSCPVLLYVDLKLPQYPKHELKVIGSFYCILLSNGCDG